MTDEYSSTRLGDLLVERRVITRQQLARAIELQQIRRQHAIKTNDPSGYTQELGEILIELGFINRSQLKSSLSWQKRLRKTTAVMVFIAPLLTAACGGGGSNTNNVQSLTQNSQPTSSDTSVDKPVFSSVSSTQSSSDVPGSSSSSSIAPVLSSSFASAQSISSQGTSSVMSSSSAAAFVDGPVQIYWFAPTHRENGSILDITEIGGYEIRYKLKSDSQYMSVIVNDGYVDAYYFDSLHGDYEFQIAAFDAYGVYSVFAPVNPQ